jgi:hypothetical protein
MNEQRFSWQFMVKGHMYLGCDSLVCSLIKIIIIIIIIIFQVIEVKLHVVLGYYLKTIYSQTICEFAYLEKNAYMSIYLSYLLSIIL